MNSGSNKGGQSMDSFRKKKRKPDKGSLLPLAINHKTMADRFSYSCRSNHSSNSLSFSSTLLEEICRSIDDSTGGEDRDSSSTTIMRKKRDDATTRFLFKTEEEMANYQRACMIERWMEKKAAVGRGRSMPELQEKMSGKDRQYSSSSSSDSSCGGDGGSRRGGFFSSSEAESFPVHPPKPVRTGKPAQEKEKVLMKSCDDSGINRRNRRGFSDGSEEKQKSESRFVKTKSKALKIYGDLKKVRQPISPGGKVAAFLNSIFAAGGNLKKPKVGDDSPTLKSTSAAATTTCSSASSFSRSCLSRRTPPPSAESPAKRSVRFSPVSVDSEEDRHEPLRQHNKNDLDSIVAAIDEELAMHVRKKDQIGCEFELSFDILSKIHDQNLGFEAEFDDEDEEFDGASCASSDLFELENLSAIGMEELPVYETTQLQKIMQMD